MLNHITIMGRLTRDPELRRTGSGIAVASFTVAVDRDFGGRDGGERETDFIDFLISGLSSFPTLTFGILELIPIVPLELNVPVLSKSLSLLLGVVELLAKVVTLLAPDLILLFKTSLVD